MNIVSVSEIQRNNLFGDATCLTKQVDRDVSDGDKLAEFGARVCYRTQKRFLDAPHFLNGIMDAKHYDVLEHSHIVFNATNTIAVERDLFMFQKYLNCAYYGYSEFGVSGNLRAWMDFLKRMHAVQFKDIRSLLNCVTSIYGNYQHVNPIKHGISNWTEAVPLIEYKPKEDFYSEAVVRLIGSSSHIFEDPDVAAKLNHASFYIERVSRVTTHQLVRHRKMSYSQASQRYIGLEKGEWGFTIPETIYDEDECCADYMDYYNNGLNLYKKFRDKGIPKEDARFILPSGIHSSIMVSGHLEDWRDLLNQRVDNAAQWEINEVCQQIEDQLHMIAPKVFPRNESNSNPK